MHACGRKGRAAAASFGFGAALRPASQMQQPRASCIAPTMTQAMRMKAATGPALLNTRIAMAWAQRLRHQQYAVSHTAEGQHRIASKGGCLTPPAAQRVQLDQKACPRMHARSVPQRADSAAQR